MEAETTIGGMKTLFRYFFRGLLFLGPLAITGYVLYLIVRGLDRMLPMGVPGLGILLAFAAVTLFGFLASTLIGGAIVGRVERLLAKLPLFKLLYTSFRDLISAFVGKEKKFDKPVAVTVVPGSSMRALGFVTRNKLAFRGFEGHVAVYFPQSYNFAGSVLVVPEEHVEPLDVASGDLMTFIVSGGVSGQTSARSDDEFETEHGLKTVDLGEAR